MLASGASVAGHGRIDRFGPRVDAALQVVDVLEIFAEHLQRGLLAGRHTWIKVTITSRIP